MIDYEGLIIEIDKELESVIPDFLESRHKDCLLIDDLLMHNNMDEISRLGHRLKGTGGSYGFDVISDIGRILEVAVAEEDPEAVDFARQALKLYLEQIRIVYV
ncbi:MAG TPA: Hpt domain-containing protein [Desulfuromonadaceae bacterium]